MGMNIYLTEKEAMALREAATSYCDIMAEGDEETVADLDECLENGLGSALRKLYKGRKGEKIYEHYKTTRD